MIFEQLAVGGDRNFAYLIGDASTRRAAVVDPAFHPELLLERADAHALAIAYLINTHSHFDHAGGNETILQRTAARLLTGESASAPEGQQISLGLVGLRLIHTPGHTTDSVCVLVTAPGQPGKLITGDTLFVGKVGGTDFAEGARRQFDSLHKRILTLPDDTEVWPGHDVGLAPHSTIGQERRTNPFLTRESFEAFVDLKRNWAAYKKAHGIK